MGRALSYPATARRTIGRSRCGARTPSMLLALCIAISLPAGGAAQPAATGAGSVIRLTNNGQDWGARINAADRLLGTRDGEIHVAGGGAFSTTAVLSSHHTLKIGPGVYRNYVKGIMIEPESDTSVIGTGWNTILMESTQAGHWTVIGAHNNARNNYDGDSDIVIENIQIRGANPRFDSVHAAIVLGNLVNGQVRGVYLNATKAIGISVGGGSATGRFADSVVVSGCLFRSVASQNLAVVNGKNVVFTHNIFRDSGQTGGPGAVPIDVESNAKTDILEAISVIGNTIDNRGAPYASDAISVTNDQGGASGPITVAHNTITGGSIGATATNLISIGINVSSINDIMIDENNIRRTGQSGITINDSSRGMVAGNKLFQVGGGGNPAVQVISSTYFRFLSNVIDTAGGPSDGGIIESGSSDYNVYVDNVWNGLTGVGKHDRASGNLIVPSVGHGSR